MLNSKTALLAFGLLVAARGTVSVEIGEGGNTEDDTASIIGGTPAGSEFPGFSHPTGNNNICGGHLVHPRVILTAAHCLPAWQITDSVKAHIGGTQIGGGEEIDISQLFIHPDYSSNGAYQNDVMLVKLSSNSTKQVLPWATSTQVAKPAVGDTVKIMGFGSTSGTPLLASNTLNKAEISVVATSQCNLQGYDEDIMFCAGSASKNTCAGDSGGPILNSSGNEIVGVVSFGRPACAGTAGNVRVAAFDNWICSTICTYIDSNAPCCAGQGFDQAPQEITATVQADTNGNGAIDATDAAVNGFVCRLRNSAGKIVATDLTDANGSCGFVDIPSFPVTLEFEGSKSTIKPASGSVRLTGFDAGKSTVTYQALVGNEDLVCEGIVECFIYYVFFGWLLDIFGLWQGL